MRDKKIIYYRLCPNPEDIPWISGKTGKVMNEKEINEFINRMGRKKDNAKNN